MVFTWLRPYRDNTDNYLQLLCQARVRKGGRGSKNGVWSVCIDLALRLQISIFFALLSKVALDHPDVSDQQSSTLGARRPLSTSLP